MQKLMTLKEVAELLNIAEVTIYRWANAGKIPAHKLGRQWRFVRSEIEEWLERQKIDSQEL